MIKINQFTQLQQAAYKEEHPGAEPKEWAVMDGDLIYSFYDTQEEAQREADELIFDDKLGDEFNEWIDTITAKYPDIELEHIYEIIKSRCH